jgi:hypothetical protein
VSFVDKNAVKASAHPPAACFPGHENRKPSSAA